jgi:hypothetical protein
MLLQCDFCIVSLRSELGEAVDLNVALITLFRYLEDNKLVLSWES